MEPGDDASSAAAVSRPRFVDWLWDMTLQQVEWDGKMQTTDRICVLKSTFYRPYKLAWLRWCRDTTGI